MLSREYDPAQVACSCLKFALPQPWTDRSQAGANISCQGTFGQPKYLQRI